VEPDAYHGLEGFDEEATVQVAYMSARSPAYARLLETIVHLLAKDARVRDAIALAWRGRVFHSRYERALLLCAALRFDALRDGTHPLAPFIAREPPDASAFEDGTSSNSPGRGGKLEAAVAASLVKPSALASIRERYVQTNEVTRAVAWRWPLSIAASGSRPAVLVDIGCSAGLNLVADRVDVSWTDSETGESLPIRACPIVARVGFDRAPIDVRDEQARLWLRAAIWPGQTERLARFDTACARFREACDAGEVSLQACDALEMPARLHAIAASTKPPARVVAYQTVFRDYLLAEDAERFDASMRGWLGAWRDRSLWCELEQPSHGGPGPAELRVHAAFSVGIRTLVLGSGEFHPTSLRVNALAVRELEALAAGLPAFPG
jgi:hypothetical protein